jgi:hypothetical protein
MISRFSKIETVPVKLGGAIALALFALGLPACNTPGPEEAAGPVEGPYEEGAEGPVDESPAVEEEPGANVAELSEAPEEYAGQTVTLQGQVEDVIGVNTFRIQQEEDFFGEDTALVITATPTTALPNDDEYVQVTGEVRTFEVAEIEQEYGLNWNADIEAELEQYENQPVVIAQSIEPIPEDAAQ